MEGDKSYSIALVGCVSKKTSYGAAARDLYVSPLFIARRHYVEKFAARWYILSAMYGLVPPGKYLEPYDLSLKFVNVIQKRNWARLVIASLDEREHDLGGVTIECHAGVDYRHPMLLDALSKRGAEISVPVTARGIGSQISEFRKLMAVDNSSYSTANGFSGRSGVVEVETVAIHSGVGIYERLGEYLSASNDRMVQVTFSEVGKILDHSLPRSARTYRAWWANEKSETRSQAKSWMRTGWKVDSVDLNQQVVRFIRFA